MKRISKYNVFFESVTSDVDRILDKINSDGIQSLTPEEISILDNYDKTEVDGFTERNMIIQDIKNMANSTPDEIIVFSNFGDDFIINQTKKSISVISSIDSEVITIIKYLKDDKSNSYDYFEGEYDLTYDELDTDSLVDIKIFLKNNLY